MNDENQTDLQDACPDTERRRIALGLLALLGGGAAAGPAQALPLGYKLELFTLNRALRKYGLQIGGTEDRTTRTDTVDITVHPLANTEYTHTVELPNDLGAIIPCVKTSYFDQKSDFVHLMPSPVTGQLEPCLRTHIEHEHAHGLIIPCVSEHYDATGQRALFTARVIHEHEEASYMVHDATAGPDSAVPVLLETRWAGDGSVSEVRLAIGPQDMPLSIDVGGTRYVLKEGRLEPQACGATACS